MSVLRYNLPDGRHCSIMSSLLFVFKFNSGLCSGGGGGEFNFRLCVVVVGWGGGSELTHKQVTIFTASFSGW